MEGIASTCIVASKTPSTGCVRIAESAIRAIFPIQNSCNVVDLKRLAIRPFLAVYFLVVGTFLQAQRELEYLDRGVVAIPGAEGKCFISWRLLGSDPENIAFNLYRKFSNGRIQKLNKQPLSQETNFTDVLVDTSSSWKYFVKPLLNGKEGAESKHFVLKRHNSNYLSIPLQTPKGYMPNDGSAGDLDGDGEYEIILHQAGQARDNSQAGITDPPIFQAYKLDGTLLWTINLGKNIRDGAHYTQFMVYDLDFVQVFHLRNFLRTSVPTSCAPVVK